MTILRKSFRLNNFIQFFAVDVRKYICGIDGMKHAWLLVFCSFWLVLLIMKEFFYTAHKGVLHLYALVEDAEVKNTSASGKLNFY